MKAFIVMCSLFASVSAFAGALPTKNVIIDKMANQLVEHYKRVTNSQIVKPKVVIAGVASKAKSLTSTEIDLIAEKIEEGINDLAVVVDRQHAAQVQDEQALQMSGAVKEADVQALGEKYGASQLLFLSFADTVSPIDSDEELVTLVGKLKVIEVKTQRIALTKSSTVEFKHFTAQKSYFFRDATSTTLGLVGVVGTLSTIGFATKGFIDKSKYDDAKNADDAVKYRKATENDRLIAGVSAVAAITAFGLQWWLNGKERDQNGYHSYELVLGPTLGSGRIMAGIVWRH